MPPSLWNPSQYERFRDERSQPFFDLLALVRPRPAMSVVDLGCGTGELTRRLHEHLQARATVGVDSAETMLARAASVAGDGLSFRLQDLTTLVPDERYDLVFSNAALQWAPGHVDLLARLTALLAAGGQLAFQVPVNDDHPAHTVAAEIAREAPFRAALGGWVRPVTVLPPEVYARLLRGLGYREQQVRLQVYVHALDQRDGVIEWVKGTMLTGYQDRLPPDLFTAFLDRYRQRLLSRLEDARPYILTYKRILAWAQA
ncbi:MAG: methyltransferase domain-containing protein [Chloroflexi bacterium]|nr:methyltransferase domain-containing protein [Chloroflexota bacterium]